MSSPESTLASSAVVVERMATEKLPPHDLRTEAAVLGAAVLGAEGAAAVLDGLDAAAFYRTAHQQILRALVDLRAAGSPISEVTVKARLLDAGQPDAAAELPKLTGGDLQAWISGEPAKAPSAEELAEHVGHLARLAGLRRLIPPLTAATRAAYEPGSDPTEIAAGVVAAVAVERSPQRIPAEVGAEPPSPEPERAPFPLGALPEPVSGFVDATSRAIRCAVELVALPLLASLAAAIGNTRRIRLKPGWIEPAVIWAAIVTESGSKKSPAFDAGVSFVREQDRRSRERHDREREEYDQEMEAFKLAQSDWKKKGRKEDESRPQRPIKPELERFWISDITVEALALTSQHSPRGLLLARDELSAWLRGFDRYRAGRGGDCAHWLEMHRAGPLSVDRKTGENSTIYVPRAAVSITGGIQPQVLAAALGQEHFADGLAARFLFAMPPRSVSEWSDDSVDAMLSERMARVFDKLYCLGFSRDSEGTLSPVDVNLSPAGKEVFVSFYNEHAREQAGMVGDEAAAWAKLEGYAARLALVIHCARVAAGDAALTDENAVDAESIHAGVTLVRWFGREIQRIYAVLSHTDEERVQQSLVDLVRRRGGRITANDLRRASRSYPTEQKAQSALNLLVAQKLGRWEPKPPGAKGGRPTREFSLFGPST